MNQPFHLYRLQQIDTQLDQAEARLAEINRLLAGDEAVRQAKSQAEQKTQMLEKARKKLKEAEFAVHEQTLKIEQSESSLYAGKVRSPKELQDMQKEIASLKKYLSQLEDRQLEHMMAVEDAEREEQEALASLTKEQARFAEQSAGWLGQREQYMKIRERLQAERSAALSLITADSLQTYDRIRKRKNGIAVSLVQDGSCSICGATVRPSEVQAARTSEDFYYCSSCGRILYAG